MEDGSGGSVGGPASSSSSTLLSGGGRQRFEVELRPGETTIVSWKKLIKDANKAVKNNNENKPPPVSVPPVSIAVPVAANPALDSRIAPPSGDTAENEDSDAPPGSRFGAVIEKIERLYMGKNSSDEEDLNDVPDDDEYDTEDSFIDDAELDDYFQVDNSAIKHDGFFVNRGKLERTNEPTAFPAQQQKKRRRKDSTKGDNGSIDRHVPNKHMKINKELTKIVTSSDKGPTTPSRNITVLTVNREDVKYQSPIIALGTVVKKPSDPKNITDSSSRQRINDKDADVALKSQGQLLNNSEELNQTVLPQRADIKASMIVQQPKTTNIVRKEGSSTKPKSTNLMLEKAILDLEKTVAQTRPPSMEVPEADNSSQTVKKRMPSEIKQKLAKVARLAHAIYGKLSKELLNRLMSILGHLIQLRSLKRNLQNMVVMGLSAKEEKDARLQQLKKEVDEMVKIRAPMMKPEVIEQQAGSSDDFQETSAQKKVVKTRFITDNALEDKICDLYDHYADGLDEDARPQVRKLYAELAELWPKGCMDNHGIKRAICRAKDRRRKDQENSKRKKLLLSKTETVTVDKLNTDSSAPVRSISKTIAATLPPNSSNATDNPKQEKLKANINTTVSQLLVKKKPKKKPNAELNDVQIRPEKSTLVQGEEKQKSNKQMITGGLVKAATQPPVTSAPPPPPPVNSLVEPTLL